MSLVRTTRTFASYLPVVIHLGPCPTSDDFTYCGLTHSKVVGKSLVRPSACRVHCSDFAGEFHSESLSCVKSHVVTTRNNFKVLRTIVVSYAVAMMNVLVRSKVATKRRLHHKSMFSHVAVVISGWMFWFSDKHVPSAIADSIQKALFVSSIEPTWFSFDKPSIWTRPVVDRSCESTTIGAMTRPIGNWGIASAVAPRRIVVLLCSIPHEVASCVEVAFGRRTSIRRLYFAISSGQQKVS